MPHPVFKDGAVAKGALAVGQTLQLGSFFDDRLFGRRADDDLSDHRKLSSHQLGTRRVVRSDGALFPE